MGYTLGTLALAAGHLPYFVPSLLDLSHCNDTVVAKLPPSGRPDSPFLPLPSIPPKTYSLPPTFVFITNAQYEFLSTVLLWRKTPHTDTHRPETTHCSQG